MAVNYNRLPLVPHPLFRRLLLVERTGGIVRIGCRSQQLRQVSLTWLCVSVHENAIRRANTSFKIEIADPSE